MSFTWFVGLKLLALLWVWLLHFTHKRWLKTIALTIAIWILIPGLDELITFPLMNMLGVNIVPFMIVYYSIGVALLLMALFIL